MVPTKRPVDLEFNQRMGTGGGTELPSTNQQDYYLLFNVDEFVFDTKLLPPPPPTVDSILPVLLSYHIAVL